MEKKTRKKKTFQNYNNPTDEAKPSRLNSEQLEKLDLLSALLVAKVKSQGYP